MEETRILRAACLLRTFTASELAEHSGANPTTVRSVLKRRESFFKVVRKTKTQKRGGQPNQYRVDVAKVKVFMRTQTARQAPSGKTPKQLDAVYQLLLWRASAAGNDEREDILDAARLTMNQVAQTTESSSFGEHRRAIDSLIALAELEESATSHAPLDVASFEEVRARLLEAISALRQADEHVVASALGQRALSSALVEVPLQRCRSLQHEAWGEETVDNAESNPVFAFDARYEAPLDVATRHIVQVLDSGARDPGAGSSSSGRYDKQGIV